MMVRKDLLLISMGNARVPDQHTVVNNQLVEERIIVMVTAAKVNAAPPQLFLFRSYAPRISPREYEKYGYLNPDKLLAWKAARATSAAPVFFESFHGLADGAIFCNNPCLALVTDFFRLQKVERHKNIVGLVLLPYIHILV
ncbi:unnamed protein product [Heligmosomoides polygyrus]|uniref:PNPLA domain-containing protein n=1 Tax=Heligmosomoides polygyrus TaxID=6339 RepID=A0A3P8EF60_HELPZ|nr:unnamed protein product [Heligmosomoides polygyrus]